MKTVYCLRIRYTDKDPWGPTEYFEKRKDRDYNEKFNRCLGGIRTWSFEEKKTEEEIAEIDFSDD